MPESHHHPNPADLARLLLALERDEDTPMADRAKRDRALRVALGADTTDLERLRAWLDRVDPGGERASLDAHRALQGAASLIAIIGLVAGMLAATGILYYDGSGRVNVLAILGVLIGLPLLLMMLSWLAAFAGPVPVLGDALHWLGGASPGRWMPTLGRVMSKEKRRALDALLGLRMHDEAGIAPVRRWLVVRWSHTGGVAFFVGVLAVFIALVLFTDLAFGWSTTLTLSSESLQRLVNLLAAPWAWSLGDALPSLEVIDATRYYRSEGAVIASPNPALLGRWWSFLVLAIVVYGLLPRAASLLIATALLRRSVARAYVSHPQARTLLDRLAPASVESQGEESVAPQCSSGAAETEIVWPPSQADGPVVNWSDVPVEDDLLLRITGARSVVRAGGARSLAEDQALLDRLSNDKAGVILVVCKAWEPPVLDLQDFLAALGSVPSRRVDVMPIGIEAHMPVSPSARDREVWQRAFTASSHRLVSPPGSKS